MILVAYRRTFLLDFYTEGFLLKMINLLVDEINRSLDTNCYIVALMAALTLPDICGKAEYPNDKPSERYLKWYDENIGQYETNDNLQSRGIPYMSGEVVYSLRNALLHQGNPNIDNAKCDIQYFELLRQDKDRAHIDISSASVTTSADGNERVRRLCVNFRELCFKLCAGAQGYYENNQSKFNFFNYNLVDWTFENCEMFKKVSV